MVISKKLNTEQVNALKKFFTKGISVLLVVALTLMLGVSAVADNPVLGKPVSGDVTARYNLSFMRNIYDPTLSTVFGYEDVYYTDEWFLSPATDYNHGLSTASLAVAITSATYDYNGTGIIKNGDARIRALMGELGFDEDTIRTKKYDISNTYDDADMPSD